MEHYTALSPYLKRRFGCKVYKLSLSAGCTCPNRDGTLGARGCIFCSGSGEFAASGSASIPEQLEQAKYILGKNLSPTFRTLQTPTAQFPGSSRSFLPR